MIKPVRFLYVDDDDVEIEIELPGKYEICDSCRGEGVTTRHIECDGGGFTASEWAEACNDDPDFAEDYFGGVYDQPCPDCLNGKVVVVNEDLCDPEILKKYYEHLEEEAAYRREREFERRYTGMVIE